MSGLERRVWAIEQAIKVAEIYKAGVNPNDILTAAKDFIKFIENN